METLLLLYLGLLAAAFGLGGLLGERYARRQFRRQGEADYMTGYQDGRTDAGLLRQRRAES